MRFASFLSVFTMCQVALAQDPCDLAFVGTPITCPGDDDATLTVVGAPGLYTYSWAHDLTLNGATAINLAPGFYTVQVIDTSGCISVLEIDVTDPIIPPLGTITVTNISCAGNNDGTVAFTLTGGAYPWTWDQDPAETNTTLTNLGPGIYSVTIVGPTCPSFVGAELGDPDVTIIGGPDYCPADPPLLTTELEFGFQPHIYAWSTGESTTSVQTPAGTIGPIDLTATDTSSGCVATAQVILNELPSPTVTFSAPDTVCMKVPFVVDTIALTDADSLVWRWGGFGTSNLGSPTVILPDPFWQPISLQGYDLFGCGNLPVLDSIFVRPRPPAIFSAEQIPCTPMVEIVLGSVADSCAFFIGDSLVTNDCSGSFQWDFRRYSFYDFTLYTTQPDRCNDTLAVTIDVRTEPTLFLPNAFTPNGDGNNDEWPGPVRIPEKGFEIRVFDRWGIEQWATIDTQEKWNGSDLPSGLYPFIMRMRDPCEETKEITKNGFVTLLR